MRVKGQKRIKRGYAPELPRSVKIEPMGLAADYVPEQSDEGKDFERMMLREGVEALFVALLREHSKGFWGHRYKRNLEAVRLMMQGMTFQEAGKRLGVSRERIRQMEAKVLRQSRHSQMIGLLLPCSDRDLEMAEAIRIARRLPRPMSERGEKHVTPEYNVQRAARRSRQAERARREEENRIEEAISQERLFGWRNAKKAEYERVFLGKETGAYGIGLGFIRYDSVERVVKLGLCQDGLVRYVVEASTYNHSSKPGSLSVGLATVEYGDALLLRPAIDHAHALELYEIFERGYAEVSVLFTSVERRGRGPY